MIRVGVIASSLTMPAWQQKIVRELLQNEMAALCLVIVLPRREPASPSWLTSYAKWERRALEARFGHSGDAGIGGDAFEKDNMTDALKECSIISLPNAPVDGEKWPQDKLSLIREARLDVLIDLGSQPLSGEILETARFGVWAYRIHCEEEYQGSQPLFRLNRSLTGITGICLFARTNKPSDEKVLAFSTSSAYRRLFYQHRNAIYWKAASLVSRRLHDLSIHGWDYILRTSEEAGRLAQEMQNARARSLRPVPFLAAQFSKNLLRIGCSENWHLAIRKRTTDKLKGNMSLAGFKVIEQPGDHFYADPFLFDQDGDTYLFFEDYLYARRKGQISCCQIDKHGHPGPVKTVLEKPYHLSYPFLFRWQENIYMIPDTSCNQTIELYRCVSFPDAWQLDRVLFDQIQAADVTLVNDRGRWWMFVTIAAPRSGLFDELYIFHAETPLGPWLPHQQNPVVSDVRRGRSAGNIFRHENRLIRPAQDGSVTYGRAVNFYEIEVLTETDFKEREIARIEPPLFGGNIGIHTYGTNNQYEVIDAKRYGIRRGKAGFPFFQWRRRPALLTPQTDR